LTILESFIEYNGTLVTLRRVFESVTEEGYSYKNYQDSSVKCIFNELTGLEYIWDVAGPLNIGDAQLFFKPSVDIANGDLIINENKEIWEVIKIINRSFMNQVLVKEVLARKL